MNFHWLMDGWMVRVRRGGVGGLSRNMTILTLKIFSVDVGNHEYCY